MSPTGGDTLAATGTAPRLVELGRISGVYGVRGWVRVHSFTEPRDNIVSYSTWILNHQGRQREVSLTGHQLHGKGVVVGLEGVEDRDAARELIGATIAVRRDSLPALAAGEYYWTDLEGMQVVDMQDRLLGQVDHMIGTGAHDVMVLDGVPGRLIPFVMDRTVIDVDPEKRVIVVDWDPSWWE